MSAQVIFNILESIKDDAVQSSTTLDHFQLACEQAASCFRNNQRVFIFTEDQKLAHEIDERLWAFDAQSFVPHNLPGEGLRNGSPVEISWQPPTNNRNILINLSSTVPNFAGQFSQIFDFVPEQEALKKLARLRYRKYQQLGFSVQTRSTSQAA